MFSNHAAMGIELGFILEDGRTIGRTVASRLLTRKLDDARLINLDENYMSFFFGMAKGCTADCMLRKKPVWTIGHSLQK